MTARRERRVGGEREDRIFSVDSIRGMWVDLVELKMNEECAAQSDT